MILNLCIRQELLCPFQLLKYDSFTVSIAQRKEQNSGLVAVTFVVRETLGKLI